MNLLKQIEAAPAAYLAVPGLSTKAADLNHGAIWQRIENWIAYRWPVRAVTWIVQSDDGGFFCPPLADWTITAVEWAGVTWEPITAERSVLGVELPAGVYRVIADVGSPAAPEAVLEAFRRLAEYLAEADCMPVGVTRVSEGVGQLNSSMSRSQFYAARALQLSGAADLLRPWRHA